MNSDGIVVFYYLCGMKHLLAVIVTAMVLVAVVTGCGGAGRNDARLVAADSLMQLDPDSALALVQAVPRDSLTRESDRAYRDLLLTQARYKCYITATSDSDINRTLDYYRRHSGEREKLTRAYIYKGAVMEELGRPDSAMFYYKHAEATAAPDDYFNLGICNLRIGELYQMYLEPADSVVRMRMHKAMNFFIACQDTNYIVISMGTLGSYMNKSDPDSAKILLKQTISLARSIDLPLQYYYQSKLAGLSFYKEEYLQANKLAMDIINNGRELCVEKIFYYYAARSFIRLGLLDSAYWVKSIIPAPVTPQDSFNYYLLQADLAKANNNMLNYGLFNANAERIHRRIVESSSNSTIFMKELECDASLLRAQQESKYKTWILWIALLVVLLVISLVLVARMRIKHKKRQYQQELINAEQEIQRLVKESDNQVSDLLRERKKNRTEIKQMDKELSQVTKKYRQLEQKDQDIHRRASAIVRERNAALNELYDDIRIIIKSEENTKITLPLSILIKDFHESRRIRILAPKESFWKKLKSAVDLEYNGIASFMEKKYPQLTLKELHLFWLLCADVPAQIIKLCMNYTTAVTVSNNKRRLMKEKLGMDIKFNDFIDKYLNGELKQQ